MIRLNKRKGTDGFVDQTRPTFEDTILVDSLKKMKVGSSPGILRLVKDVANLQQDVQINSLYAVMNVNISDKSCIVVKLKDTGLNVPCSIFLIRVAKYYPHEAPAVYYLSPSPASQFLFDSGRIILQHEFDQCSWCPYVWPTTHSSCDSIACSSLPIPMLCGSPQFDVINCDTLSPATAAGIGLLETSWTPLCSLHTVLQILYQDLSSRH